ncbi:uncharacterized protein (DUF58 family) [Pseudoduganella lurida]|uniref:Uncharacterized protein (DUF58 family) n=1 Tax=Pseudoduganella lurida TaxID=1036180 RepID=A0A562QVW5_9BURK|nr:DUF58 domain-containing protein [Pseudoduganella lurida]TWI60919.1 uncharacterized protein (DUF58 family) [Pseudoduganella lurida]
MVPARRLLAALGALVALGIATGLWPVLLAGWWAAAGMLLLAAMADALLARRPLALRIERQVAGVLPAGVWQTVRVTLHNEDAGPLTLALFDDYPADWELEGLPHTVRIAPGAWVAVTYRVRPVSRGDARFGPAWLRSASPLGLWRRSLRTGPETAVRVFPDFSAILGQALRATDRRVQTSGALRKRQRGEGLDFRQLREYRQGDSLRSIDWKATARHRKPISREYQVERDQQIVFLLDTGRRMLAREDDGGGSHFDHALHALLTLAYVAAKQGDGVGALTFGSASAAGVRWLAPAKGRAGLDRLLAGLYDVQPDEVAPDYLRAASDLVQRLPRRAFVVLITNVRDEDDLALRAACDLLAEKHLVLCASLRESAVDDAARQPVAGFPSALRLAAAEHYLQQREAAIRRLGLRHERFVDVTPQRLGVALLNRYLAIKESGAL